MEAIVEAIALKGFPQSCQTHITSGLHTATYIVTISVDGKDLLTCDFSGKGMPINKPKKIKAGEESKSDEYLGNKFTCKILDKSSVNVKIECKHGNLNTPHEVSSLKIKEVGTNIKLTTDNVLSMNYTLKKEKRSGTLTLKVTRVSTTAELTLFKMPVTETKCLYTVSDLEGFGIVSQVLKGDSALNCPEWVNFLGSMGRLLKIAAPVAEVDPHAKITLSVAKVAFELFMKQKDRDERVLGLVEVMGSTYQMILDSNPLQKCRTLSRSINDLIALTRECSYFIAEYIRSPFGQRAVINAFSNADDVINEFEKKFLTLKESFLTGVMLSIGQITMQILNKLETMDSKLDLIFDILSFPVLGKSWSKLDGCIEGTQKPILSKIYDWGFDNNVNVPNIFLLLGVSEFAKTAIAHTVSSVFYDRGRLGATIFFDGESSRNAANFFPSIIRELSSYHPAVHAQVISGLKTRNVKFINDPPARQFHFLISQVLNSLKLIGPLLLVIDNLHKCVDRDIILQLLVKFPRNIRLLITSEPINDIVSVLSAKSVAYKMNIMEDQEIWSSLQLYILGFLKVLEESRPVIFSTHTCADIAQAIYSKSGQIEYVSQTMLELIATMEENIALSFTEAIFTFQTPEAETRARENIKRSCINLASQKDSIAQYEENQADSIQRLASCGFSVYVIPLKNLSLACNPSLHCNVSNVLLAVHEIKDIQYLTKLYRHQISRALHCILTCKCSHPPEAMKEENKSLLEYLLRAHQANFIQWESSNEALYAGAVQDVSKAILCHHTFLKGYDEKFCHVWEASGGIVYLTPPLQHSGLSTSTDKITLCKIYLSVNSYNDVQFEAAIYRAVTKKGKDTLAKMQIKLEEKRHVIEPYNGNTNAADVQVVKNPLNGEESWFVKNLPMDVSYEVVWFNYEVLWFNCPIPTTRVIQNLSKNDAIDGQGIGFVNSLLPGDRIAILANSNARKFKFVVKTSLELFTEMSASQLS